MNNLLSHEFFATNTFVPKCLNNYSNMKDPLKPTPSRAKTKASSEILNKKIHHTLRPHWAKVNNIVKFDIEFRGIK